MNKKELLEFKNEVKLVYSDWLKETKDGKKVNLLPENAKDEWLKEYPNFCIGIDICEKEGIKDKYILVIIKDENDFKNIHKDVRAKINPSKINDWHSVYVKYVARDEEKAKYVVEKLVEIKEPETKTYDSINYSIWYHVYYVEDGKLERIH